MRRTGRILAIAVGVLAVLATGGVGWLRIRYGAQADVGAGYAAKQLCSCVFVGGRTPEQCWMEFGPEMQPVRWEVGADEVRAWVPLVASRRARAHDGTGCSLE
jgi:hypothetical protein